MLKRVKRKAATPPSESEAKPRTVELSAKTLQKWLTGWTATTVLIPVVILVLGLPLAAYWNRPQLSISMAKALTGSYRVVRNNRVYEYRAVQDLQMNCLTWLVEYSAPNDDTLPPPIRPRDPRVVYGIYLENLGRSELSDIRLTFSADKGEFEVTASPQLSLTQSEQSGPSGEVVRMVTIASLAPGAAGVVIGALPAPGGRFAVEPSNEASSEPGCESNFQINIAVEQINRLSGAHSHLQFIGSRELSQAPISTMSVNMLFTRQQAAFGLDALALPIEPIELSPTAEHFERRGPFHVCDLGSGIGRYSSPVFRRPLPQAAEANVSQAR